MKKFLATRLSGLSSTHELAAKLDALNKSQAVIEFDLTGMIIHANENFLKTVGYRLDDIKGKHHSLFVDSSTSNSPEYRHFWDRLARGEYQSAEYKRFGRDGKEIWIQASYNPIFNTDGKPFKVVKYATETTQQKIQNADYVGQINAVNRSQAVIEFDLQGNILNANENFLSTVDYSLDEVKGKHHSLFVDRDYKNSSEYRQFWESLRRGEYKAAQYKRFGRNNKEVWIQASYNPIFDLNNKPVKVIKYATDITKQAALVNSVKRLLNDIDNSLSQALRQSTAAASASILTSTNVQMVASGAEELNASVLEIASSMSKSRDGIDKAFALAADAENATQRLSESTRAMTGIVDLIQDIASQINLLSLNATIESARAGEAGRGFAVVAGEVKNLAKQAADATEKISREIEGVQTTSGDVVNALSAIKKSVEDVRSYVTNTAGAVEEQSAVSQEMSSNMHSAAQAVSSISTSLAEIEKSTQEAGKAMVETKETAEALE